MKLLALLLIFSSPAFSKVSDTEAKGTCYGLGMKVIESSLTSFDKFKSLANATQNMVLARKGIKEIAEAVTSTILSEDFDKLFHDMLREIHNTRITDEKLKDYHQKMMSAFEKARPQYFSECKKIILEEMSLCNISPSEKDLSPAKKICIKKMFDKLDPVYEKIDYNAFQNKDEAVKLENELWALMKQNKSQKEIEKAFSKRMDKLSYVKGFLAQFVYEFANTNNTNAVQSLLNLLSKPQNLKYIQDAFVDKHSVLNLALKHKDLIIFKALIESKWLTKEEAKEFSKTIKNENALKILKQI